jgi:predicted small lipoprotein YifL
MNRVNFFEDGIMLKQGKKVLLTAVVVALVLPLAACGKSEEPKGPAEKAGATMGKALDQATEQAGQAMEKSGDALKEAGAKIQDAGKEAADNLKK